MAMLNKWMNARTNNTYDLRGIVSGWKAWSQSHHSVAYPPVS